MSLNLENADIMTAIITPFNEQQQIDYNELERLTNHLIENGSRGFVIGGTTGETPTLTHDEKIELYTRFGEIVDGRVPVIAGTGSNNTAATIEFTNEVSQIKGIDYALVVVPYYNKPDQEGMIAHFEAIAANTNIPLFIYNIPGRTGVTMNKETVVYLSHNDSIAGVKQCTSLEDLEYIVEHTQNTNFAVYSGEDVQALTCRVIGGNGIISVASHTYGPQMRQMYTALYNGDIETAGRIQRWLTPRMNALFMFPSPTPVKAVLNAQGFHVGGTRLPLVPLNQTKRQQLATSLELKTDALEGEQLPLNLGGELND